VQGTGAVFEDGANHDDYDIKRRAAELAENKLLWKPVYYTFDPVGR
jgi:hypothetical protein